MNLAHNHLWAINELENSVKEKTGDKKLSLMKAIERNKVHLHAINGIK